MFLLYRISYRYKSRRAKETEQLKKTMEWSREMEETFQGKHQEVQGKHAELKKKMKDQQDAHATQLDTHIKMAAETVNNMHNKHSEKVF
jgi:hypothetical protein